MGLLIELIIVLVALAVLGYAAKKIIEYFELPKPALWIAGAILLIALLIWATRALGGGGPVFVHWV